MSKVSKSLLPQIDGYEAYKAIAYGGNGSVYLGLPSKVADKARQVTEDRGIIIQGIRDKIVAIKKPHASAAAQEQARKEVKVLETIKKRTAEDQNDGFIFHDNFAQILDVIEEDGVVKYIIMKGIAGINLFNYHLFYQHKERDSPKLSLDELTEPQEKVMEIEGSAVPAPFVFRIFLEIGATIEFMHNVLEIAHTDLKPLNVMIRERKPDGLGLPEIAILDFGSASFKSDEHTQGSLTYEQKVLNDRKDFYLTLYTLVSRHRGCGQKMCTNSKHPSECTKDKGGCKERYIGCNGNHPPEWAAFEEELENGLRRRQYDLRGFLGKFEEAAERIAVARLERIDEHNLGVIIDALMQKEMNSEGISNAELGNAIWRK